MSSDELSFEELGLAFARAMKGNLSNESDAGSEAHSGTHSGTHSGGNANTSDEFVDFPDELMGEDPFSDGLEGLDDFEIGGEPDPSLAMFDENGQEEQVPKTDFRSFADEIDDDRLVPINPQTILEAMLFVGNPENRPIAPEILSNLMRGVRVDEIRELVQELNEKYEKAGNPWEIVWFEEEHGYFMQLRETFAPLRENFYGKIRQARLSQGAIDTLAIIAYEQPISLDEINELRGTASGSIVSLLMKRDLLRSQKIRRGTKFATVYYTTERFLQVFELESISDLPQSEDLERE